jgi:exoribonuclease R
MLQERVGEVFDAAVTEVDDRGARIQLTGLPVIARLAGTVAQPGTTLPVRLAAAQPESRSIVFEPA